MTAPRGLIEGIQESIAGIACRRWPEIAAAGAPAPVEVRGQLELERGDLYSSCCFDFAEVLRLAPERISAEIAAQFEGGAAVRLSAACGFLNMRLGGLEGRPLVSAPWRGALLVMLPQPSRPTPVWPAVRLAARAMLQHLMAQADGAHSRLLCGEEEVRVEKEQYAAAWRELLTKVVHARAEVSRVRSSSEITGIVRQLGAARAVVWRQQADPKRNFERAYESRYKDAAGAQVWVRAPGLGWFAGLDELGEARALLEWSDADLLALMVYLAGEEEGRAVDLLVPRVGERANLPWALKTAVHRGRRAEASRHAAPVIGGEPALCDDALARRVTVLPLFAAGAVERGEIGEFLAAFGDALKRFHHALCVPRPAPAHYATGAWPQIMAGACAFFSSMMERYPFLVKNDIESGSYD